MTQKGVSAGFVNEKFSFSLAIIVSLILAALSLSHYVKTNTTYLQLRIVQLETEHTKAGAENEKQVNKSITQVKQAFVKLVYVVIIPTLIFTLWVITFFFFVQIIFRGMWFYVNDFADEAPYTEAAFRLDRLAQIFYSLSFGMVIFVFVTLICLLAWFAAGALIRFIDLYLEGTFPITFLYGLPLVGLAWLTLYIFRFAWHTYRGRHTRVIYRTGLRVVFLLIFLIGLFILLFLSISPFTLVFIWPFYFLFLFMQSLRPILRYVDRMTGVFCLLHSLIAYTAKTLNLRRRLGIAIAAVSVLALFIWADYLIVNASYTFEIHLDKHVYRADETSVITIIRAGLLEGKPSLQCVNKDNHEVALKQNIALEADDEDIASLHYFLIVDPTDVVGQENEGVVRVIARHDKAGLFGRTKVQTNAYLKVSAIR